MNSDRFKREVEAAFPDRTFEFDGEELDDVVVWVARSVDSMYNLTISWSSRSKLWRATAHGCSANGRTPDQAHNAMLRKAEST